MTTPNTAQGQQILHAVERILASTDDLLDRVANWRRTHGDNVDTLAEVAIREFSNISCITGAGTALPAMIPGFGTAAWLLTGPLADLVLSLKTEVEMGLCLSAIHGQDIRDPAQRQLALLFTSVHAVEARGIRPVVLDAAEITGTAVFTYAPRRVGKALVTVLAVLAAAQLSRGLFRAIPVIGVVVGAGMNKVMTTRVGRRMHQELTTARHVRQEAAAA